MIPPLVGQLLFLWSSLACLKDHLLSKFHCVALFWHVCVVSSICKTTRPLKWDHLRAGLAPLAEANLSLEGCLACCCSSSAHKSQKLMAGVAMALDGQGHGRAQWGWVEELLGASSLTYFCSCQRLNGSPR